MYLYFYITIKDSIQYIQGHGDCKTELPKDEEIPQEKEDSEEEEMHSKDRSVGVNDVDQTIDSTSPVLKGKKCFNIIITIIKS